MKNLRLDRLKNQLKTEESVTISTMQFLTLVVDYNGLKAPAFSSDILGKPAGYIVDCGVPRTSYGINHGFDEAIANKLSTLFDKAPYNNADFWQKGPITLQKTDILPLIPASRLPKEVFKNTASGEKPRKLAEAKTFAPPAEDTFPYVPLEKTQKTIGAIEKELDNYMPETIAEHAKEPVRSAEREMDTLTPEQTTSPAPQKVRTLEEEMDDPAFKFDIIDSVKASGNVPNIATDIQYEGKATAQKSNQRN